MNEAMEGKAEFPQASQLSSALWDVRISVCPQYQKGTALTAGMYSHFGKSGHVGVWGGGQPGARREGRDNLLSLPDPALVSSSPSSLLRCGKAMQC